MHPILSLIPTAQTDQTALAPERSPQPGLRGTPDDALADKGALIAGEDELGLGIGDALPAEAAGKAARSESFAKVLAGVAPVRHEPTPPQPAAVKEAALPKGEVKPDAPKGLEPKRTDIIKSVARPAVDPSDRPNPRSQSTPELKGNLALPASDNATRTPLSTSKILLPNPVPAAKATQTPVATQVHTSMSGVPPQAIPRRNEMLPPPVEASLNTTSDMPPQTAKKATADVRQTAVFQTARQPKDVVQPQAVPSHPVARTVATELTAQTLGSAKDTGVVPLQVAVAAPSQRKSQTEQRQLEPSAKGISVSTQTRNAPQPQKAPFHTFPMPQIKPEILRDTSAAPPAFFDAEPLTGLRSEAPINTTSQIQAAPLRSDLPQHISRQIAEVLQQMPARPVEITLSPEELGRVRLAMSSSEAGIVVSVLAERPETMDLLRRHIGSLETAFQHIGYDDVAFSFAGQGDAGQGDQARQDHATETIAMPDTPAPVEIALGTGATSGLDIRL